MAAEEKTPGRGTIATAIASAAVTLAIGVTAAALSGYLAPVRDADKKTGRPTERTAVEARSAPRTVAPNVVLVPIAPDGRGEPAPTVATSQQPELRLAAHDTFDQDDHDHQPNRWHHEHENEEAHDDTD